MMNPRVIETPVISHRLQVPSWDETKTGRCRAHRSIGDSSDHHPPGRAPLDSQPPGRMLVTAETHDIRQCAKESGLL